MFVFKRAFGCRDMGEVGRTYRYMAGNGFSRLFLISGHLEIGLSNLTESRWVQQLLRRSINFDPSVFCVWHVSKNYISNALSWMRRSILNFEDRLFPHELCRTWLCEDAAGTGLFVCILRSWAEEHHIIKAACWLLVSFSREKRWVKIISANSIYLYVRVVPGYRPTPEPLNDNLIR